VTVKNSLLGCDIIPFSRKWLFCRNIPPPSTLKMESAGSSKTLAHFYQVTKHHNQEDCIILFCSYYVGQVHRCRLLCYYSVHLCESNVNEQICDQDGLPYSISTVPSAQTICLLGHYDFLLLHLAVWIADWQGYLMLWHVWDNRQNSTPLHVPHNMLIILESSSTFIYSPFRIPLEHVGTTAESLTFWLDDMHYEKNT
jgi:hypothetical protein